MLTVLENLRETMKKDGHPDRFVNSWEFVNVVFATNYYMGDYPLEPGKEGYDQYGVYGDSRKARWVRFRYMMLSTSSWTM
ncbi:MAG: hypothetical protein IKE48_04865 [Parasporobacterium sp.]|nr:hypothetical protein [Parasporobacterium sp.]